MRARASILLVLTTILALATLVGCKKESDEDLVRATIQRALDGVDEKAAGKVVADAAPDFKGPNNADLSEVRRILVGYFMQPGWVRAVKRDLEIEVTGEAAKARLAVLVARGNEVKKPDDLIPTNGELMELHLELAKREGRWQFTKATYTRGR